MRTALLLGSTGLVGSKLLMMLLNNQEYARVVVFNKRDSGISHPKLIQHIIDFEKLSDIKHLVSGHDFFCTIGTTIKKAGSKPAFQKVDYEYPRQFSMFAQENNVNQFLIVTSIGADDKSANFYLKTKGQIEAFLKDSFIESVSVLQPSLLLGQRNEFRLAEKAGAIFSKVFSFLLFGSFKKYKPIHSETVAKAMISLALKRKPGFHIYPSDVIDEIGNS